MAWPYELVNGIEVQFVRPGCPSGRVDLSLTIGFLLAQWNHLGHFALIQPLLPLLISTSKKPDAHVRIVLVSSLGGSPRARRRPSLPLTTLSTQATNSPPSRISPLLMS